MLIGTGTDKLIKQYLKRTKKIRRIHIWDFYVNERDVMPYEVHYLKRVENGLRIFRPRPPVIAIRAENFRPLRNYFFL